MDQEDLEPKQTNQIFKLVILMLLMANRVIMSLSVNVYIKVKKMPEFSLRLFIWKVRRIVKRLLMLQKNFATWIRIMVQEQVEVVKKRATTIFGMSYRDVKSSEQTGSGTRAQTRAKPKFLLGR